MAWMSLLLLFLLPSLCQAQLFNLTLSAKEGLPAGTIVGHLGAVLSQASTGFFISESRDSDVFQDLEIDTDTGIISTAIILDRETRDGYEFVAAAFTGEMIQVKITVTDVNDHSPKFPLEKYDLVVSELSPIGSRFKIDSARDQDVGEFGIQGYHITQRNMADLFELDYRANLDSTHSLYLVLRTKLDRESCDFYSLTVEALDGGVPSKSGSVQVNVHVQDENDNAPVFNQTEYHAVIREDAEVTVAVCQVQATDQDLGENGRVTYELKSEVFYINESSGMIHLNKPLDFEEQASFGLIVTARDSGAQAEFSSAFVRIQVLNVNDNSPSIHLLFLSESGEPAVSEAASVGDYVARISVSDPDLQNQPISVQIWGGDGKFTLKQTDDFLFALRVESELDREEKDFYEIRIQVSEGGFVNAEEVLLLKVLDVNDCYPKFETNIYTVHIPEDVPPGSSLVQVRAWDEDEPGLNSQIKYAVMRSSQAGQVSVDARTGLVVTVGALDRESQAELWFLVVASDSGDPPLSSTATVTVLLDDVNDNEPVFSQPWYNVSLPEHSPVHSCFLQVVAIDLDAADLGTLQYSLIDGFEPIEHPLFYIQPQSGELCVSQDIDRDLGHTAHDLVVKAQDPGGLSSQTHVHIDIEDLNDNAPVFNPAQYTVTLSGHSRPGTEVITLTAIDADSGLNGQVSYRLLSGAMSSLFTLDTHTGLLSLASGLGHLGDVSLRLSISAQDGGGLTSSAPAEVTVHVLSSSQAPAVFQRSHYTFSIPEDTPAGTSVGSVHAVHPNGSGESVAYHISSGDPLGWFTVHPGRGVLSTLRALDHETHPYILLVLQCSTDSSSVYSITQVNVSISDVNDNAPVFPQMSDTITISKTITPGTILFIAHAQDHDSSANGRVKYKLENAHNATFAIDANLGTLTVNKSMQQDSTLMYALEIVAEDEGEPPLSCSFSLTINVEQNAAENNLAFETLTYEVQIGESYRRDSRVIQVRAHQSREPYPLTSGISYSIENQNGVLPPPFRIHPKTGWLYLAESLDYETETAYRFHVRATASDVGQGNMTATATVSVLVLDMNDNAPVFSREVYYFTVPEGAALRGLVGTVRATDKDSGNNGKLSYILLSDGKFFRVNAKTGELIQWVALDREQQSQHTLRVMVTDQGQPRLNASCSVHITVSDINDNRPQFTHSTHSKDGAVQIWAGAPAGSLVTTAFAKDLDAGENGTVLFSVDTVDEDAQGPPHFEVDSRSGDIRTTQVFSHSPKTHYTLRVTARDRGAVPLEEWTLIHVQVHGADPPSLRLCPRVFRRFTVREDAAVGTVVGSPGLSDKGPLNYVISEEHGPLPFGIHALSGDIYISQPLDYESTVEYCVTVHTEGVDDALSLNTSVLVCIIVEDANDHAPVFHHEFIMFGLREDAEVGSLAYAFQARDADGTLQNSEVKYSLTYDQSHSERFPLRIDPTSGHLTVAAPLDRETVASFAFTVTATDQAERREERRSGAVTAQLFLLDVNDNRPVFVSIDTVQVMEDTEVGALLHHLVAIDGDEEESGRVSYCIIAGDQEMFTLDEKTGLLFLSYPLDYETQRVHRLTIRAVDQGHPSLSSTQTLSVDVGDVNDQRPLFSWPVYDATVAENRDPGAAVVRVSASDGDSEQNAVVWYSLLPGPGYELFSINPYTGLITTTSYLDREEQQNYTLRVQACDSGSRPLSSTSTVLCSVLDTNDNPPEFMQSSFQISLPENLPPGVIHTVQAADSDHGENGTIHYSIQGQDHRGRFIINSVTGAVSTTRVLDREETSNYTLTIQAQDHGPTPLSSSTQIHVLLLDQNDNTPTFPHKTYQASISEGLAVGSEVIQLTAFDPDEGANGEITYSLMEENGQGTFSIDPFSGIIRTSKPLDRETRSQYSVRVVASDCCTQGPLSSAVLLTVQVEDVNDNAPVCTHNPVNAWVSMTMPPHHVITTVTATDKDHGENGTVRYMMSDEEDLFYINGDTGEVSLRRRVRVGFSGAMLHVVVSDRARTPLTSTCLLFIHLLGEREQLQFTEKVYNTTVNENSRAGTWITKVEASDPTNSRLRITYTIFSGNENNVFSINRHTGEVRVQKGNCLDFERSPRVELVVLADNGLQSAHSRVFITLQDVNDHAPLFEHNDYRTAVWEGQVHDTYVMQIHASDADSGLNGQIEYSIISGNHNNAFILDSVRGILATNVVLDREITSSYKLVLHAADKGNPPFTSTATVRVQVVDVNDNSPTIPPMEPVLVPENLLAGYMVTQVVANDVDLASTITYSFGDNSSSTGQFAIDCYTGVITLTQSLDYETQTEHMLTVRASDSLHHTTGEVKVQVLDVNDNAPVFTQVSYQVELSEFLPAETFVVSVSASDRDSGLSGEVIYRLLSSPLQGFYILPDLGSVFTNKPLKSITNSNVVHLLVEARDQSEPVRSSVASIEVQIVDSNDHAPVFHQDTYSLTVPEDTPTETTLLTLSADDEDWSPKNTHLDYAIVGGNEEKRFCLEVKLIQVENQLRNVAKLVLCNPLDRETTEMYSLTVSVSDRGKPPLNSTAFVTVSVTDCNDNAPKFSNTEYHIQVSENSVVGTRLVQVHAYDPDVGANGLVRYDIVSGNSKQHLTINSQSGVLAVNQSLDYEEDSKYTVTVRACDGSETSDECNVAFAVIYVTVLDENDNAPYFMFPTVNCSMLENLPAFTHMCSINAMDDDSGPYGLLTYSILTSCLIQNPDHKDAFGIDSFTGDIHTRQTFDYERENEYCFLVEARDKGEKAATLRVQVAIKGVDEFSPVFTQKQYYFLLGENAKPGETVGFVMAVDHDGGIDGQVEYALLHPSPFFLINKTTGAILVSDPVFHKRDSHRNDDMVELIVCANSPKLGSRTTRCPVYVNISSSAEALTGVPLNGNVLSLGISLLLVLVILVIFVGLVLLYKLKDSTVKKASAIASSLRQNPDSFFSSSEQSQSIICLHELKRPSIQVVRKELPKQYSPSDSSGHGSAEGETAEDLEIKWINTLSRRRGETGHEPSEHHDSALPGDNTSNYSVKPDPEHMPASASCLTSGLASTESLHHFKEEGGGEGLLPAIVRFPDLEENMGTKGYAPHSEAADSLTSLIGLEEQVQGSYAWDYLLDWEPQYHMVASVFTDIGMLPDEELQGGRESLACDVSCFMHPPPLITAVAQPGLRTVPPRKPSRARSLSRQPSYPRYCYSPLASNTGLTPSAMTPTFSPSLTSLTVQTPRAFPVVSDSGVGGIRLEAGPPTASLLETEIQV
ncbi:protocadherin-23 [Periophthalmus magnuspinnatus]|uniref:protocadherin-23 n=1 Tax=Periophthalmus magnuspinnatus TaxID=409849 RepID=UPI002436711D|nr:protocadherin-23 [Periophthalmus magnuspinnatus]